MSRPESIRLLSSVIDGEARKHQQLAGRFFNLLGKMPIFPSGDKTQEKLLQEKLSAFYHNLSPEETKWLEESWDSSLLGKSRAAMIREAADKRRIEVRVRTKILFKA